MCLPVHDGGVSEGAERMQCCSGESGAQPSSSYSDVREEAYRRHLVAALSSRGRGDGVHGETVVERDEQVGVYQRRRSRRFAFTVFGSDGDVVASTLRAVPEVIYFVCGNERCPRSGRAHVQGYVEFSKRVEWSHVRQVLEGAHVEIARGTTQENVDYCKKEGDFIESGRPIDATAREAQVRAADRGREGGERERDRWTQVRRAAERGDWAAIPDDIYVRHYGALRRMFSEGEVRPPDLTAVCGYWIYGVTGLGKSHSARELFPDYYPKECSKWWDRYRGQATAIVDDFELYHRVLGHHLKIWGDRYSYVGEIKCEGHYMRPKHIVITSNYSIHDVFGDDEQMESAVRRRYVEIWMRHARQDISHFVRTRTETPEQMNFFRDKGARFVLGR